MLLSFRVLPSSLLKSAEGSRRARCISLCSLPGSSTLSLEVYELRGLSCLPNVCMWLNLLRPWSTEALLYLLASCSPLSPSARWNERSNWVNVDNGSVDASSSIAFDLSLSRLACLRSCAFLRYAVPTDSRYALTNISSVWYLLS